MKRRPRRMMYPDQILSAIDEGHELQTCIWRGEAPELLHAVTGKEYVTRAYKPHQQLTVRAANGWGVRLHFLWDVTDVDVLPPRARNRAKPGPDTSQMTAKGTRSPDVPNQA